MILESSEEILLIFKIQKRGSKKNLSINVNTFIIIVENEMLFQNPDFRNCFL